MNKWQKLNTQITKIFQLSGQLQNRTSIQYSKQQVLYDNQN